MEQGHRQVADVVGGELEHLGDGGADAGQPALAAEAGLGRARRPRREEQVAEGLLGHPDAPGLGQRGTRRAAQARAIGVDPSVHQVTRWVVDDQDPVGGEGRPEVVALHERAGLAVGDQELALGV